MGLSVSFSDVFKLMLSMMSLCRYGGIKGDKADQSCSVPKGDTSLIVISVSPTVTIDKSLIRISKRGNR